MQSVGLAERITVERIAGERPQDHQRRHSLPIRWAFIDLVAAIRGVDRLDPVRALGGEVLFFVQPAKRFQSSDDLAHDRAVVKGFAALPPDPAQRGGERRVAHLVPGLGRSSARQEKPGGNGIAEFLLGAVPVGRDARRHHITLLGRARCRLEQFGKRSGAVLAIEGAPGIDRAGDRHRMRRLHADLADAALDIPIDRRLGGGAPGTVERHRQGALPRIEDEAITTDSGAFRLDDALHGDRRNRGISRVAARAQHVEGSQSRHRVRGRGHAVRRHRRRPTRNIEVAHNRAICRVAVAPSAHRSPAVIPLVRD